MQGPHRSQRSSGVQHLPWNGGNDKKKTLLESTKKSKHSLRLFGKIQERRSLFFSRALTSIFVVRNTGALLHSASFRTPRDLFNWNAIEMTGPARGIRSSAEVMTIYRRRPDPQRTNTNHIKGLKVNKVAAFLKMPTMKPDGQTHQLVSNQRHKKSHAHRLATIKTWRLDM